MRRKSRYTPLEYAAATAGVLLAARSALRRLRAISFRERTVLITGGSRGLGLVMARQLADEGARLVICARDGEELERARQELSSRGAEVLAVVCDVGRKEEVERMMLQVRERFGALDVLINNAGTIEVGPVEEMTLEDFQEAMQTHFWGPLHTTLAAMPILKRRGEGRIVNISSIGGKVAIPHLLPYSASKFALVGFSEGLRAELAKEGIRVTTVCPGLMRTGSPPNATFKGQHRAEYAWFSLGDALPVSSMQAERAARKVLEACRRGEAEVVLSIQAKLLTTFHDLFPGLTSDLMALADRLLPGPGGIGKGRAKGYESGSTVSPSWLTRLSDRASIRNNELPATEPVVH